MSDDIELVLKFHIDQAVASLGNLSKGLEILVNQAKEAVANVYCTVMRYAQVKSQIETREGKTLGSKIVNFIMSNATADQQFFWAEVEMEGGGFQSHMVSAAEMLVQEYDGEISIEAVLAWIEARGGLSGLHHLDIRRRARARAMERQSLIE